MALGDYAYLCEIKYSTLSFVLTSQPLLICGIYLVGQIVVNIGGAAKVPQTQLFWQRSQNNFKFGKETAGDVLLFSLYHYVSWRSWYGHL